MTLNIEEKLLPKARTDFCIMRISNLLKSSGIRPTNLFVSKKSAANHCYLQQVWLFRLVY
ncbi:hypothetical protein BH23BAC3_BH23BAC3_05550 [soil metagenome]